jgi:hypothetical protein
MRARTPPNPYFSGINFNPRIYQAVSQYIPVSIANTKYLLFNGLNNMTGNLGIKRVAGVELYVNGKTYMSNGLVGVPRVG